MLIFRRSSILNFSHFKTHHSKCLSSSIPESKIERNEDISLCIIGNGAEGNPHSTFLNYHDRIFMFNCSEGVQRLTSDLGFKPSKIDTFFTTSSRWHNVSGLSSILLNRYNARCRKLNIYNRFNESLIKHCTVFDTKLSRIQFEYLDSNYLIYEKLTIKAVPIDVEGTKTFVYLGNLLPEKGKINLEKCFQLNVPRHLVVELERDHCVLNQNGQTIKPSDVCYPNKPEQNFMIFECFDKPKHYLNKLIMNDEIKNILPKCEAIVHFTRDEYLSQQTYKNFFQEYNSSYHLLITESNPPLSLYSTHRFQIQLNNIDPKLFPLLQSSNKAKFSKQFEGCKNIINSPTGVKYVFRSSDSSESSTISLQKVPQSPTLSDALLHKDGTEREGIEESLNELRIKQSILSKRESPRLYPEFVFLGTASSFSLPIRNVSIILVNLSEHNSFLIECGENAYGQLLNFYGENKIVQVLKNIKAIFISHHHSDHHMGLIRLLEKHRERCHQSINNKLWILVPPMVYKFFKYSKITNLKKQNYHLVMNQYFDTYKQKIIKDLHIQDMDLIPVDHCAYAYGISITDQTNFKFVYSGDTQPCNHLIERGRNCQLLIHEATVEDGLSEFARTNFHSTISEAIKVGKSMQANFTILTHFSQRYGKLPFVPDDQESLEKVGIAFDNMKIQPDQFDRIPLLYDTLKCMFSKHLEKIKYRSDLYTRRYSKQK